MSKEMRVYDYKVVEGFELIDFQEEVRELLNMGYKLVGGVVSVVLNDRAGYLQAVVKYKYEAQND